MTVWTLEACTNYEGRKVVGAYASVADALAMVEKSDESRHADDWDAAWLSRADGIRLAEMDIGAAPCEEGDGIRAFERMKPFSAWWVACHDGQAWKGTAAELLALVTP